MLYYLVQAMDAPPDSIITIKSDALYLNLLFVIYGHLVGQTYSAPPALAPYRRTLVDAGASLGRAHAIRHNLCPPDVALGGGVRHRPA